jgi:hypothetical protein
MGCGLPKVGVIAPNLREFRTHKLVSLYFPILKVGELFPHLKYPGCCSGQPSGVCCPCCLEYVEGPPYMQTSTQREKIQCWRMIPPEEQTPQRAVGHLILFDLLRSSVTSASRSHGSVQLPRLSVDGREKSASVEQQSFGRVPPLTLTIIWNLGLTIFFGDPESGKNCHEGCCYRG